jgi:hypothetical protein
MQKFSVTFTIYSTCILHSWNLKIPPKKKIKSKWKLIFPMLTKKPIKSWGKGGGRKRGPKMHCFKSTPSVHKLLPYTCIIQYISFFLMWSTSSLIRRLFLRLWTRSDFTVQTSSYTHVTIWSTFLAGEGGIFGFFRCIFVLRLIASESSESQAYCAVGRRCNNLYILIKTPNRSIFSIPDFRPIPASG